MLTKEFNIVLDMQRTLDFAPFEVVQGDTGNVLHVTLQNDGEDMDLTDCDVSIVFASSKGFAIQDLTSGVSLGAATGRVDVTLYPASYGAGDVRADMQVYSGEERATLITSRRFTFRCRTALINEEILRANATYPPLIAATQAANAAAAAANAAAAQIGEMHVRADWTEEDAASDAFILHKPASFAPTAHAASHGAAGADPVTPASIGAATPGELPRRNLLDNWEFAFPVNQPGTQSGVAVTAAGYFLDRWRLESGSATWTAGTGLALADGAKILQYLELDYHALLGKTATASVKKADGAVVSGSGAFPAAVAGATVETSLSLPGVGTCKLGLEYRSAGATIRGVSQLYVPYLSLTASAPVSLAAVKLELGGASTLASDAPMDYAAELARCRRYYFAPNHGKRYAENKSGGFGFGYLYTGGASVKAVIPPMRIVPSVTMAGSLYLWLPRLGVSREISTVMVEFAVDGTAILWITALNLTGTTGDICSVHSGASVFGDLNYSAQL